VLKVLLWLCIDGEFQPLIVPFLSFLPRKKEKKRKEMKGKQAFVAALYDCILEIVGFIVYPKLRDFYIKRKLRF
jgi:hypothetical protein